MTLDAVTGLYYERNRNYSPTLGRWRSQDPLQYINGANTYQFVNSSPVGAADPMGDELIIVALEGLGGYRGKHPGGKPNQLLNWISQPYLKWFLQNTGAWRRKDTVTMYYPEYSIGRAVSQVTPMLTKPIGGSGPDKCKYNTILVVGFSNGGSAALRFAGRLAQKGIKVNAGFTVDPIAQGLQWLGHVFGGEGHFFFKPRTTAKWINFYQHGDNDYFGVLQGNPVRGAQNRFLVRADYAQGDFYTGGPVNWLPVNPHPAGYYYTGSHKNGWTLLLKSVMGAFETLMDQIPYTRSNYK
jgi:RHS repeat-associated protein